MRAVRVLGDPANSQSSLNLTINPITRLHPQGKGGPEGTFCDRSLKTVWYVKITNFHRFKSFPQLTHKNNSKIHFELQACHSSLVVLSFWRHTPKFPIFSRSCHQIGFKLQFDGKSVTGRTETDGRKRTDGRTNIKKLERPYTKSPFGAIKLIDPLLAKSVSN